MSCRAECGACCTAPSISSPLPGLPEGKPAGVACPQLDSQQRCQLFQHTSRPKVCAALLPSEEMCGRNRQAALDYLTELERLTAPAR